MNKLCLAVKDFCDTVEYVAIRLGVTVGVLWLVWVLVRSR